MTQRKEILVNDLSFMAFFGLGLAWAGVYFVEEKASDKMLVDSEMNAPIYTPRAEPTLWNLLMIAREGMLVMALLGLSLPALGGEGAPAAPLFEDNFTKGLEHWVIEKWGKDKVEAKVEDGKLCVETGTGKDGVQVWLKQELPKNFIFEYDFIPQSQSGFFLLFFCQKGTQGEDILADALLNDRKHQTLFMKYTLARNGYHISYRRNEEANCNLRKNAGKNLLKQQELDHPLPKDKKVHVKLTKTMGQIKLEVDGEVFMEFEDKDQPYAGGRIGFRQVYESAAQYSQIKLTEVK